MPPKFPVTPMTSLIMQGLHGANIHSQQLLAQPPTNNVICSNCSKQFKFNKSSGFQGTNLLCPTCRKGKGKTKAAAGTGAGKKKATSKGFNINDIVIYKSNNGNDSQKQYNNHIGIVDNKITTTDNKISIL
jgi:hypothetical protein